MKQTRFKFSGKPRKSPIWYSQVSSLADGRLLSALLCMMVVFGLQGQKSSAFEKRSHSRQDRILHKVNAFRAQLEIGEEVQISIVPREQRLVSVQRLDEEENTFVLTFDRRFLDALNEEELTGVIAHELGHVWIFTHHPFLQTERLANDIAMKVVPRETLVRVYQKVSVYSDQVANVTMVLSD